MILASPENALDADAGREVVCARTPAVNDDRIVVTAMDR
jgi:hypothetical protein